MVCHAMKRRTLLMAALATPYVARAQNKQGWEYMAGEQFENAAKAFQQAVETDPDFDMPWYGLGRAHLALRQYVSAISALSRRLAVNISIPIAP